MKIGILYPRSNAHPEMMTDFMHGIKMFFKLNEKENCIQLLSESIGFGGNEKEVYEKAEKLLLLDGADVLVAYLDLRILEIIKPLIYSSGKLLLVVNPGANYPQNWVPQPHIIYHSLQHGFLCWLTGKLAATLKENKAISATTFYDCGYLHLASVVKGFVEPGGIIMFNYINNQRYDETFEITQLTDYLSSDKETNILVCVFDSLPASLFYEKLNKYDEASRLHLFVSPMMLEKKAMIQKTEGLNFPVSGYVTWHPSLMNEGNRLFLNSYQQQNKTEPSIFSLLGWEAGLILNEIFLLADADYSDGELIANKLAGIKINSPRGEMILDTQTHYFISPVYKFSHLQKSIEPTISEVDNIEKEWKDFIAVPLDGPSSGWTNTYLCY